MREARNPVPNREQPLDIVPHLGHDTSVIAPHRRPNIRTPVQNHPVGRVMRHRDGPHQYLVGPHPRDRNIHDGGGSVAGDADCGLLLKFRHDGRQ